MFQSTTTRPNLSISKIRLVRSLTGRARLRRWNYLNTIIAIFTYLLYARFAYLPIPQGVGGRITMKRVTLIIC